MKLRTIAWFALGTTFTLCACGGGGGGSPGTGSSTTAPPVVENYTFPAGGATAGPGNTAWDIVGVKTTLSDQFGTANKYDTLRVDVTFSQNVASALPSPGQQLSTGTELGIHILLDVDGNPQAGAYGICDLTSPLRPFEYSSDQGNDPSRLADGNYSIIGPDGDPIYQGPPNPPAEAQTSVSGNVLTEQFFLGSVGVYRGASVPEIGVAVASFNGSDTQRTDCVPSDSTELSISSS